MIVSGGLRALFQGRRFISLSRFSLNLRLHVYGARIIFRRALSRLISGLHPGLFTGFTQRRADRGRDRTHRSRVLCGLFGDFFRHFGLDFGLFRACDGLFRRMTLKMIGQKRNAPLKPRSVANTVDHPANHEDDGGNAISDDGVSRCGLEPAQPQSRRGDQSHKQRRPEQPPGARCEHHQRPQTRQSVKDNLIGLLRHGRDRLRNKRADRADCLRKAPIAQIRQSAKRQRKDIERGRDAKQAGVHFHEEGAQIRPDHHHGGEREQQNRQEPVDVAGDAGARQHGAGAGMGARPALTGMIDHGDRP